jgi:purine-nucleoside phosphorylase
VSAGRGYGAAEARNAADAIQKRVGGDAARVGLILGSGLGGIAAAVEKPIRVPYSEIPGFPPTTVEGHASELIVGSLGGHRIAAMSGRFHMYEGHSPQLTAFPARVLHALGSAVMIVSNAAGSLSTGLTPGSIMLMEDHINLMFRNPLVGPVEQGDVRFPDMSDPYDRDLRALASAVAARQGIPLTRGVYVALLGPSYETRTEVKMLARLGGDAVGMSTVPEVLAARALGVRVLGLSCVTNWACGLSTEPITHEDVLATTARVAARMQSLVAGVLVELRF